MLIEFGSLLLLVSASLAVKDTDLDAVKELKCFEPETVPISLDWVLSNKLYYHPYMSKLELYKASVESSGRARTHEEVLSEGCYVSSIIQGWGGIDLQWGAFGEFKNTMLTLNTVNGLEKFEFFSETGKFSGVSYTVLTDNKSYALLVSCVLGDMTWSVASLTKTLPEDTLQEIHTKVKELGFKEEFFMTIDYEKCNFDNWHGKKQEL